MAARQLQLQTIAHKHMDEYHYIHLITACSYGNRVLKHPQILNPLVLIHSPAGGGLSVGGGVTGG